MSWIFRDATAIAGIGETAYTKAGGTARTELDLACEAIARAVGDAGLTVRDVDGLVSYSSERAIATEIAQTLGLGPLRFVALYPGGGNSAAGVVHDAALAVGSGTARTVVCYRSICQGQHLRFGRARAGFGTAAKAVSDTIGGMQAFTMPFGLMSPAQMYALDARRHMHELGTTSEHFGRIAVACYAAAQRNPRAVMRGRPLTLEMHQASRMIADPYRLYDCCQESDGACALVVTSRERATHPVLVTGAAQGMAAGDGIERHRRPESLWSTAGMAGIAEDLYASAGIGPEDIDVAQVYENFTGQVLMALEDFGLCRRGEGGPFVASGAIDWPDGDLPINTSGGNLAEAYIHGLSLIIEGVRQMRGTSTSQVENARHCLVASGPSAPPSSALILRRG
ncbi:MAG: thiolase C-terminal domain-containing protein [Candidatus Binatia bacterium]